MKRVGNLYDKIYDIDNIREAHKNARKRKHHYKEVKEVDADVDKYCYEIQAMLRDKTFVNGQYEVFKKVEKGKEREIYKLPYFPDRIIHHAIMQVLEPIWKKTLIADTYQSIKGRGIHKAKNKIQWLLRKHKLKYALKMDIKKFYPSVDNEIMKQTLRRKIKCKDTLWLLDTIVDSTAGIPIGNYLSQYFGNLYLTYLDHELKEQVKVKYYYRYCDDIVVLSNDKAELHNARVLVSSRLASLRLVLKKNYQVQQVKDRGLDFLGYRMFHKYTLLRKKIAAGVKHSTSDNSDASYNGWLVSSNGHNLARRVDESRINRNTRG